MTEAEELAETYQNIDWLSWHSPGEIREFVNGTIDRGYFSKQMIDNVAKALYERLHERSVFEPPVATEEVYATNPQFGIF